MGAITTEPRRVAVVVPTWNGGERYRELLRRLDTQALDGGFQLVVIDSGSTDGTAEVSRAAGALCLAIPQREFNHGATRNRAIAATDARVTEVVVLLTQDALPVDEQLVGALAAAFDDARVDGAYARQFPRPDADPILAERLRRWSASRDERVLQTLVPEEVASGITGAERAALAQRAWDAKSPIERYLTCAFDNVTSALRRSSWEHHPLPERSFGEDVAWAREVLLAGGAVSFEPAARVEHSHPIDIRREFKRLYCDHRNLLELFGLRNVPSWKAVWSGWGYQRGVYRRLLRELELPWRERAYWNAYAVPYALAETAAQFLGARSHWKTEESLFWRWADGKLRDGV